ncbi:hypothetical protein BM477_01625 [Boudabousia marimammalium]|uniref:YraN family protein n=2 Tax=Boudabousia marimammalium TaxID=156892 RepID=A0A1Q5PS28_9ACTO|nr:hypothetical protein BM477_01625 [Boudabousia marimammalium]
MLTDHGWEILDRNWRCRNGEIDIVACKGRHLAVIEVKTRSSDAFGSGAEAVTVTKVKRMRKLAALWLQAQDQHWSLVSLDVIEIAVRTNQPALLRFIRSVG